MNNFFKMGVAERMTYVLGVLFTILAMTFIFTRHLEFLGSLAPLALLTGMFLLLVGAAENWY